LNATRLELRAGDVLFIKRGDWHEDICEVGLRYLAINFDLAGNRDLRAADVVFNPSVRAEGQVIRGRNTEIWRVLNRMQAEPRHGDHVVGPIENTLLQLLFWTLIRALPQESISLAFLQQFAPQAFSARLRQHFHDRIGDRLTTPEIAAAFGVSVRTITKRCQDLFGRPPAHAFMHYKMECAARALRQTDEAIKNISHSLGFQNQYHFSRVFHRYFGTPPSSYRGVPK
jgi:AraC-like DNA-binding protein